MHRRSFLSTSLQASALALAAQGTTTQAAGTPAREYYELRAYQLRSGEQTRLIESYLTDALIPALHRLRLTPVGAFSIEIGPEAPTIYLLIPGPTVEAVATSNLKLADDAQFLKAAEAFWNAPAIQPAFVRVRSSLLAAFAGHPNVTLPAASAAKGKRMFELRTYESPTYAAHVRKVEMFHKGEFAIFERAGFSPIFYGDALIGANLPQLTYMLSFADMAARTAMWEAFRNDPEWKKLSSDPRYATDPIVSNITNVILSPLACSQV